VDEHLKAVKTFADNVLKHGRDVYGPKRTPLFLDGINVDTLQPPRWKRRGEEWVLSNVASQQNLFRVLVGVRWLQRRRADGRHFLAYALAYKLSKEGLMWWMTRSIGRGLGLGDLGELPGKAGSMTRETSNSDPLAIFGLLELYEATPEKAVLDLARRVADNALATRFHNGLFVESSDHVFACFDDPTPLALLHLRAAILGLPEKPPAFWCGRGYLHCPFDGKGRTYDLRVVYGQRRKKPTNK